MITEKETTRISKFLSLILRHDPAYIQLELDENGWADIHTLIEGAKKRSVHLTTDLIDHIVETNAKKRFSLNADKTKIRANQGHSVSVDLQYEAKIPPAILYHGTAKKNLHSILANGLQKQKRHHVHLSADKETALAVGKRHGEPVVLLIAAEKMHADGFTFYISDNGVWLTDVVAAKYINEYSQ
ncbi:MAG: RNA 2'-phosphotransferase [Chitinophagales bacterium]|nr:RNA 2'-phosphotransferase [Chitinophagales bacterium]